MTQDFRARAAPSPTGRVHTGNLRTFLNNFLASRHAGGANILRIEDTDKERAVEGGVEAIVETLQLFGITFDEGPVQGGDFGPYTQSERLEIYQKHAFELAEKGHAYYCFCSKERLEKLREEQTKNNQKVMYDRFCRDIPLEEAKKRVDAYESFVIRMKFPLEGSMSFVDEIYGKITVENKEIDDMIILKSDLFPTYHFAAVVDDHLMGITHVFRGREYLTQTTRNVFLYNSFGWNQPKWVHTPHLLNPDGKGKLSKRKGAMPGLVYLRKGYLPEAVLNYLALSGWSPDSKSAHQDEVYTVKELIELFDIKRMQKSNARYDEAKLNYLNGKHIRKLTIDQFADTVVDWAERFVLGEFIADRFDAQPEWTAELREKVSKYFPLWQKDIEYFKKALALEHERITVLSEIPDALDFFYEQDLTWEDSDWNTKNHDKKSIAEALSAILPKLEEIFSKGEYSHDLWEKVVRGYADEIGWKHGDLFLAIRSATTGRLQSPPLIESFEIMGWEKVEKNIHDSIFWLSN
jgi:glutamyl-tRNA synthetase